MAYYAYQSPRLNSNSFNAARQNLNPLGGITWDYLDPQVGYEAYLSYLNPSANTQEKALRVAMPNIYNRYSAWVGEDWLNRQDTPWTKWLGSHFDPNYELAKLSPNARFERPGRFGNSARWVSF